MAHNYTLKYRNFDTLVADVASDFKKYQVQGLLDPQDLVKVAKRVNYDLGLRINQTKEVVLEVENGRVHLPNDFYTFNFALVLAQHESKQYLPQGTHIEERLVGNMIPEYQVAPPKDVDFCKDIIPVDESPTLSCPQCGCDTTLNPCMTCCAKPSSCVLDCKGNVHQVIQTLTYETRYFKRLYPLKIITSTEDMNGVCPNLYWESALVGELREGWLHTSFQTGKVYINYEGLLEDKAGNLLVVDHDLLNDYYEYALKQRIIENLIMNDEEVNPNKIQLIESRYKEARTKALSLVNTPNFGELRELYQANRNAMYSKYYDMFASYPRNTRR